jgi:hypothetical protein
MTMTSKPTYMSDAMERAWRAYQQGLEDIRGAIFNHRFAEGQRERNEAQYLFHQIQAQAFHITIVPRPDFPRFYTLFEPGTFNWGVPNPDFTYSRAYLDGRRTYRIWGKRSNALLVLMQSSNGHLTRSAENAKFLGNYNLDEMQMKADGSFELIASATPRQGNWIALDLGSDRNVFIVREAFDDWDTARRMEIHAEAIDDLAPQPMVSDEADMIHRLEDAVAFMKAAVARVSIGVVQDVVELAGGWNRFIVPKIDVSTTFSAPEATYNVLPYNLQLDEALIVEIEPPNPKYWGIQLSDLWNQAIDYFHHHSSLNKTQAAVDSDGKIRVVVCHCDPGIRNWVTPVDSQKGTVLVRWYLAEKTTTPNARLVRYAEIARYLPLATARVTADERRAEMKKRRQAIERRYNI